MDQPRNRFDMFLENFFNVEIYFFSSKTVQHEKWGHAYGEKFGTRLHLYFEAWEVISKHREKFRLTSSQLDQLQKLYDMVYAFQLAHDYPTQPRAYQVLLSNPEWHKIQRYAGQLYNTIGLELYPSSVS